MKRITIILSVFLMALISCEKDSAFGLEIYLLTDYQTKSTSKEIIAGTERLSKNPIIYYPNIIYYDSTDYCFLIDSTKASELNHKNWSTQGTAFSLTIDGSIIYSGYFMPGYSSSGVDWFNIDPLSINSRIYVRTGYPMDLSMLNKNDPRNDERIISLLLKDNKLK